jgi:phospholipid/cholesterol/gamma-HCH transport system substrate-binding protein
MVVLAGMIVRFGKYTRGLEKTYEITVVFPNVGGIVKDASVQYGGINVGKVHAVELDQAGILRVNLKLSIYEGVKIRNDAKFVINQAGLLGDRYVDVIPQSANAPLIKPGDVVEGSTSVDLSEAIRSVVDVLKQAASTIERVDKAIKRVDETVLAQSRLDHIANSMSHIELMTSNTVELTLSLRNVVEDNRTKIGDAVTGFANAADSLSGAADEVQVLVQGNAGNIGLASRNLAESTQRLNTILARLEQGEGTAGKLLVDATLYNELVTLSQTVKQYGFFYNTWFGPKLKRAPAKKGDDTPAGAAKKGQSGS